MNVGKIKIKNTVVGIVCVVMWCLPFIPLALTGNYYYLLIGLPFLLWGSLAFAKDTY